MIIVISFSNRKYELNRSLDQKLLNMKVTKCHNQMTKKKQIFVLPKLDLHFIQFVNDEVNNI